MIKKIFSRTLQLILLFTIIIFIQDGLSQSDNISSLDPVYSYLKRLQVQGVIKDFDDSILPLSRGEIIYFISEIEQNKSALNGSDREFLNFAKTKYFINRNFINLTGGDSSDFFPSLLQDSVKHLYRYIDSNFTLTIDPTFRYKYIHYSELKSNSNLFDLGGEFYGGYKDWFGFYFLGSNGIQAGNRSVAELDKTVKHSYTFNVTKRNNFDFTLGYLKIKKDPFELEIGRQELFWGNGYINKMIISDNAQPFDFIKFRIEYKALNYTFLHGWLVHPSDITYINEQYGENRSKISKYLAISRLNYKISKKFSLSTSQMIIYANRPIELAYLNPFLFWESAQRSLNDLDNSLLNFDGRYLLTDGIELCGTMIFDDINFEKLFKGKWTSINNGFGWQLGSYLTYPYTWKSFDLKVEYMQFRPFLFTHPGLPGALTYTNNGELIGSDLQPNSTRFNIECNLRSGYKLYTTFGFQYTLHGENIFDVSGNLIKNVGGDVFQPVTINDPDFAYLLDGRLQKELKIYTQLEYEILFGYYFTMHFSYSRLNLNPAVSNDFYLWGEFKIALN